MKADRLIFIHLIASLFMTGVIWLVQAVHYPLFAHVSAAEFPRFESDHSFRISFVVMPPMLIELITAGLLLGKPGSNVGPSRYWLAALTLAIWSVTFLVHMPQHQILAQQFNADVHRELVVTNWGRTILWSLKSVLVARMFLDQKLIINHASPALS